MFVPTVSAAVSRLCAFGYRTVRISHPIMGLEVICAEINLRTKPRLTLIKTEGHIHIL